LEPRPEFTGRAPPRFGVEIARSYTRDVVSGRSKSGSEQVGNDLARPRDVRQLVAGLPRLSLDQISQLLTSSAEAAPPETEARLVEGMLWVVLDAAEARQSETIPLEDLFQEGSSAVVTFVHGLDPRQPLSSTEFLRRVRQAVNQVIDAMVAEEVAARLEDLRWAADAERLFAAEAELRLSSASAPSDLALAGYLNWPATRVAQLRHAVDEARSQHDAELIDILSEIETE